MPLFSSQLQLNSAASASGTPLADVASIKGAFKVYQTYDELTHTPVSLCSHKQIVWVDELASAFQANVTLANYITSFEDTVQWVEFTGFGGNGGDGTNYGGAGVGSMISTSVTVSSLIVSVAGIGSTTNGIFTVGIISTFPSVILSGGSIKAATNTNFTCIRTTQIDPTTFDYSNNPIDPVTVGIMGNDTLGLGHKLIRVNNPNVSPVGPFQWKEVMTANFADKADAQLNDSERYLRSTYPEPACGAGYARYYPGNISWPVVITYTYDTDGVVILQTSSYAPEGSTVTVGFGLTTPFGIGTTSTSSNNPTFSGCSALQTVIDDAETSRDVIIARNTPKIDSLIASSSALRSIRDKMEGQAFAVLQGRVYGDVEINKLKTELAALRAVDLKQYEPQTYYFNPDTGKTSSSTVGVGTV